MSARSTRAGLWTATLLAAAAVAACGSGGAPPPAAPPDPPTFEEDIRAAGLDEISDVDGLRELADIICDSLRGGVTPAEMRTLLVADTPLTSDQAADMVDIAVRHECEDQA